LWCHSLFRLLLRLPALDATPSLPAQQQSLLPLSHLISTQDNLVRPPALRVACCAAEQQGFQDWQASWQ
jgi:hypothetical protein